jgi:hypothetical protein
MNFLQLLLLGARRARLHQRGRRALQQHAADEMMSFI